jgi:N-carbamoyl-L-amino-acid hydrolase
MAKVGATLAGGVSRIALTAEDVAGRELLRSWVEPLGCEWRSDHAGNVFIRRPGSRSGPAVAFGSHLDSQPDGGAFDGALGVLAGLEILRALDDADLRTELPLELIIWTDEEGARFDRSCVGSSIWSGALDLEHALGLNDASGVTFDEALASSRQRSSMSPQAIQLESYFELHIEQGPQLERAGVEIGVVQGIVGIRWLELRLVGSQSHAGTTPMDERADALRAAANVVAAVERIGTSHGADGRGTVCVFDVEPNAGSVIPGRVRMVVDLRHSDERVLDRMAAELGRALDQLGPSIRHEPVVELWVQPPIAFASDLIDLVGRAADQLGMASERMLSGAGHDAGYVASRVPTAMIFVPSRDGLSHQPQEWSSPEACAGGAAVLLRAVLTRAMQS